MEETRTRFTERHVAGGTTGRRAPRASSRVCGFWSTFLYHCSTNQTGMEIVRPNFLPITLILIRR